VQRADHLLDIAVGGLPLARNAPAERLGTLGLAFLRGFRENATDVRVDAEAERDRVERDAHPAASFAIPGFGARAGGPGARR
jgi:hypothetical protein